MSDSEARCDRCNAEVPEGDECPVCGDRTPMLSTPGVEISGYRVLRLLGRGGMGSVFLAEEEALGRPVAIKVVAEGRTRAQEARARFLREARTMATVEHPHVVRVYSLGQAAGSDYVVMEYVEGESLAQRLGREGRLPPEEALRILGECVEGLDAAWAKGIVHRDVKPGNILLDSRGGVRVADFGLAKSLSTAVGEDSTASTALTHAGHVLGTPHYMSPEQARGEASVDLRSDIYSLGIVLSEMLTGRRPFQGATPFALVDQHMHAPLPSLRGLRPEVSEGQEQLAVWMTQKEAADRPGSYAELALRIEELRRGEPALAAVAAATAPPPTFLAEPEISAEAGRPVFVAREEELEELSSYLHKAVAGRGQVVFISGEAGAGKTALVDEMVRRWQETDPDLVVAIGRCSASTGFGDPYLPFREVLSLLTGDVEGRWAAGFIAAQPARRLWDLAPFALAALVEDGPDLIDVLVAGAPLLERARERLSEVGDRLVHLEQLVERRAAAPPGAGAQQSALFEQFARVLESLALKRPLVLVLDDLHWADAASIGLLFHLGRRIAGSRVLIVGTYRPSEVALGRGGERHPLEGVVNELRRDLGEILVELGQTGGRRFVDALIDSEANRLGEGFRVTLHEQTQGHALFTVELLRTMQDRGLLTRDDEGRWVEGPDLDWEALPARVEGVIAERIERLPEELKEVLTLASVEGQDFTAEVVARLQKAETRQVVRLLGRELERRHRLVTALGVRRTARQRLSLYRFWHIMFQRYLYGILDEAERAYLHEDVGRVLEELYGEETDDIAVQLAHHFQEAGVPDKAIGYLAQAGRRALGMAASQEAIGHFNTALQLLQTLPATPERANIELGLQLGLAVALQVASGYAAPNLDAVYARTRELCAQIGDTPQLIPALYLARMFYTARAEFDTALEVGEQIDAVALQTGNPLHLALAHLALGAPRLYRGELVDAQPHLEQVIAHYDPLQHGGVPFLFGGSPGVIALVYLSWVLWLLGYPEQAAGKVELALALAQQLGQPPSLVYAGVAGSSIYAWGRQLDATVELIEAAEGVAEEYNLTFFLTLSELQRGCVDVYRGKAREGVEQIRRDLDAYRRTGAEFNVPSLLSALAEGHAILGQMAEGLTVVEEAIAAAERTGERFFVAELHRLQGELLSLPGGNEAEAEVCFLQAVETAGRQRAHMLELRATASLARLWQRQGRIEQARDRLQEIYDWFSEGFETPDLKDAVALLEELKGKGTSF